MFCPYCGGPTRERFVGDDESLTFCKGECDDMLLEGVTLLRPMEVVKQFKRDPQELLDELVEVDAPELEEFQGALITEGIRALRAQYRIGPGYEQISTTGTGTVFEPTYYAKGRRIDG